MSNSTLRDYFCCLYLLAPAAQMFKKWLGAISTYRGRRLAHWHHQERHTAERHPITGGQRPDNTQAHRRHVAIRVPQRQQNRTLGRAKNRVGDNSSTRYHYRILELLEAENKLSEQDRQHADKLLAEAPITAEKTPTELSRTLSILTRPPTT